MDGAIKVKKKRPFSSVSNNILEDKDIRTETRLILTWLIGRPRNWIIRVSHVIRVLGLSKSRWARARREMEDNGYLTQTRHRTSSGQFVWTIVVSETPDPVKKSMVRKTRDGCSANGIRSDITPPPNHKESNTPLNPPVQETPRISFACFEEARRRFSEYDIQHLERQWQTWTRKQSSPPRNNDKAFLGWARKYVERNPLPR